MKITFGAILISAYLSSVAIVLSAEKQPLIIGMEGDFRPWNFTGPDGDLDGFEVELIEHLCLTMKVTCKISVLPFDGLIPALKAKKIDAIASGMQVTIERERSISFSDTYGNTGQSFATLKTSNLANLPSRGVIIALPAIETDDVPQISMIAAMFQGKTIGVQTGSTGAIFLEKYLGDSVTIKEYETLETHDLDLITGRVDAVWASVGYLHTAISEPGNENMILTGPYFQGGILGRGVAVGLRKNDTVQQAAFNAAIADAKIRGTIKTLSIKWFGFDITPR